MEWPDPENEITRLLPAGEWNTLAEAHEHALVILAMGIDCSVHRLETGYEILTTAGHVEAARHELSLYAAEQTARPVTIPEETADHPAGVAGLLTWATMAVTIFLQQLQQPDFTDRFSSSSRGLIDHGEWWRPFTGLFLHADPIHLFGNLLIGGMFFLIVAKSIGAWRAWPLIFAAATLANAINAAVHYPEPFSSIGASTAGFAALGILVGLGVVQAARSNAYRRLWALAIPLLAGLILFSWLGTSGETTDVAGHAWGGICGVAAGIAAGWLRLGNRPPAANARLIAMNRAGPFRAA